MQQHTLRLSQAVCFWDVGTNSCDVVSALSLLMLSLGWVVEHHVLPFYPVVRPALPSWLWTVQ